MDDHKRRIERAYKKGFPIQYKLKKHYGLFLESDEYIWFDLMYPYSRLENLDWNSFEYRINQPNSSLDMGNDVL